MRILRIIPFLLISLPLMGQAQMATQLTAYWSAAGACPAGVACITNYTLSITPPSGTQVVVTLPATTVSYAWIPGGNLPYGTYDVTITTNVTTGFTTTPPSTFHMIYASGVSTGTAPGGFAIRYTQ